MRNLTRGGWLTGLLGGFLVAAGLVWAAEELQLTTWYPAPRGDYQNLVVNPTLGPPNLQIDGTPDLVLNGMALLTDTTPLGTPGGLSFSTPGTPLPVLTGSIRANAGNLIVTGGDPDVVDAALVLTGQESLQLNVASPDGNPDFQVTAGTLNLSMGRDVNGDDEVTVSAAATATSGGVKTLSMGNDPATGDDVINLAVAGGLNPAVRINGSLAAVYAVGQYDGNGLPVQCIEMGFRPAAVIIAKDGTAAVEIRFDSMPVDTSKGAGGGWHTGGTHIRAFAPVPTCPTGFTVGANDDVNQDTKLYYYIAIGQKDPPEIIIE